MNNMFKNLSCDELSDINGGGPVTLFLSCIAISVSPAVTCLCPPAGLALAGTGIAAFANNMP